MRLVLQNPGLMVNLQMKKAAPYTLSYSSQQCYTDFYLLRVIPVQKGVQDNTGNEVTFFCHVLSYVPVFALWFYKLLLDFPFSNLEGVRRRQELSESETTMVPSVHNEYRQSF